MINKKKLGIIGGMGSRAGSFFLKKIIDYSPAQSDQEFPEIIFHNNSVIPDRTRAIVYNEQSPLNDILKSIHLFNQNQVEVIALACITSYYYYSSIAAHTKASIINPLPLMAQHIKHSYPVIKRVGLLATTGTINTGLFHNEFNNAGIETVTLAGCDQEDLFMRSVYMRNGFKSSLISPDAWQLMNEAVDRLTDQHVDVIVGGCTEVSIAIEPGTLSVPYIDTLDLLARKTVEHCYNDELKHANAEVYG